jgi:uncharacterized membrane protein YGL010W
MDYGNCSGIFVFGQVHHAGIVENFGQMLVLGPFFIILEVGRANDFSSVHFFLV